MANITYTMTSSREARCSDCMNCRYYYPNPDKLFFKRHTCTFHNRDIRKNDRSCKDGFVFNCTGVPMRLEYKIQ